MQYVTISQIRTVNDLLSLDFASVTPESPTSRYFWQMKASRCAVDVWKETLEGGGMGTQVERRKRLLALHWVAEVAACQGGCHGEWPVSVEPLECAIGTLGLEVFPDDITEEFLDVLRKHARDVDAMARALWLRKRAFDHGAKAN